MPKSNAIEISQNMSMVVDVVGGFLGIALTHLVYKYTIYKYKYVSPAKRSRIINFSSQSSSYGMVTYTSTCLGLFLDLKHLTHSPQIRSISFPIRTF